MGAIVMDDAVVPSWTIVAAGAVVLEKQQLEPNSIYAGTPAKKVKDLDPSESQENLKGIAAKYVMYSEWYKSV
jgi:carbonic anhydrase/acetyltransferase-like protein (isoleucine patch superfamily)